MTDPWVRRVAGAPATATDAGRRG